MKIVIDIDQLLEEGRINGEEHERFKGYAVKETKSLAFNILVGLGVIATAAGVLALLPSEGTAVLLGFALSVAGIFCSASHEKQWGALGVMLLLVGAITAGAGILALAEGGAIGFLIVTVLFLGASVLAKSGLLAAMAAISLMPTMGAMVTGDATYFLAFQQPTVTIIMFTALSLGFHHLSKMVASDYKRLAIIFARTSLFVVNLGFWVGSLRGFNPPVFVIAWAVALVATGVWAAKNDKRWVVNLLAVFGTIHFFTQFFTEWLEPSPGSILIAGLTSLGIAFAIVRYNKDATYPSDPTSR